MIYSGIFKMLQILVGDNENLGRRRRQGYCRVRGHRKSEKINQKWSKYPFGIIHTMPPFFHFASMGRTVSFGIMFKGHSTPLGKFYASPPSLQALKWITSNILFSSTWLQGLPFSELLALNQTITGCLILIHCAWGRYSFTDYAKKSSWFSPLGFSQC